MGRKKKGEKKRRRPRHRPMNGSETAQQSVYHCLHLPIAVPDAVFLKKGRKREKRGGEKANGNQRSAKPLFTVSTPGKSLRRGGIERGKKKGGGFHANHRIDSVFPSSPRRQTQVPRRKGIEKERGEGGGRRKGRRGHRSRMSNAQSRPQPKARSHFHQ